MGLSIENSPIWADVQSVIHSNNHVPIYVYSGMIHTEKEDFTVIKMTTIDIIRDYDKSITDQINISCKIGLGDYTNRVYPYRDNLEFTLKIANAGFLYGTADESSMSISIEKYKAVFIPTDNPPITGSEVSQADTETLNISGVIDLKLQLLNRSIEPMRIKTVSGIYRQVTQQQLIFNLLNGECSKIQVDGKLPFDGIDFIEPDNDKVKTNVVIPDGTKLVNLPTYLHEKVGGVYKSGLGSYFQTYKDLRIWFIYPLYDYNRFDTNSDKVIFYNVPEDRLPGLDKTYYKDGNTVKVVCTSKTLYNDSANVDYMNKGVGFRMADANAFMKKPTEIKEGDPQGTRVNLNFEVITESLKDGLNFAPVTSSRVSNNPYKEFSNVSARTMSKIELVWENGDPSLIHPGMPCMFCFMDKDKFTQIKGTIIYCHWLTALQGQTITGTAYRTVGYLAIAADSYNNQLSQTTKATEGVF